jgi:hypothetical protein
LALKAYRSIPFDNFECHQSVLYNPSYLKHQIQTFLDQYNLQHAWSCIALSGPGIIENIVNIAKASPQPADFRSPTLKKIMWDYRYLYPHDDAHYAFYVCGISRHLFAQYQLLAISCRLSPLVITTERMVHLRLYKQFYGAAFRHSQLAKDMRLHNNQIENLCSPSMLHRFVRMHPPVDVAVAFGLFLLGKDLGWRL